MTSVGIPRLGCTKSISWVTETRASTFSLLRSHSLYSTSIVFTSTKTTIKEPEPKIWDLQLKNSALPDNSYFDLTTRPLTHPKLKVEDYRRFDLRHPMKTAMTALSNTSLQPVAIFFYLPKDN